jgi:quaternary ammonium compound-resistance protein SugE
MKTDWIYLVIAGVFEMIWAMGIKYTNGFTKLYPSLATLAAMAVSVYLLSLSVKTIPIGTAYAVWTGIGAVSTVIMGIIIFHEPVSLIRALLILLIIFAIVGLKLTNS